MTLYGWDASDFDWDRGPMDLGAAYRDGIRFFTHKATEGTRVIHRHYGEALNRARAAGFEFVGAYVVPRTPGNNAHGSVQAQVDFFLKYLDSQTPWWRTFPGFMLQVDSEHWGYDNVSGATGAAMCAELGRRVGTFRIHYAPRWSYGDSIPGPDPLWASAYGRNPAVHYLEAYRRDGGDNHPGWAKYSGRVPTVLQYGSRTVIGSQSTCDANAFRGSIEAFRAMVTGNKLKPEGDTVITLIKKADSPAVWRAEGGIRTLILTEQHLAEIVWQSKNGGNAPLAYNGEIQVVGNLDAFGVEYPPPVAGSGAMTDAQLAELKAAVLGRVPTAMDLVNALLQRSA